MIMGLIPTPSSEVVPLGQMNIPPHPEDLDNPLEEVVVDEADVAAVDTIAIDVDHPHAAEVTILLFLPIDRGAAKVEEKIVVEDAVAEAVQVETVEVMAEGIIRTKTPQVPTIAMILLLDTAAVAAVEGITIEAAADRTGAEVEAETIEVVGADMKILEASADQIEKPPRLLHPNLATKLARIELGVFPMDIAILLVFADLK
jgi:hypothetical protein